VDLRKYLALAAMVVCGSVGDLFLKQGMAQVGVIALHEFWVVIPAVFNPWVALGIILLLGFFASYSASLSWSDLTYVMPATSFGYVLIALLSRWVLHEHISLTRWIGIALISSGVAIVGFGPSKTNTLDREKSPAEVV
jgi:drug/metabolite transporter (DMT)-like permease